MSGIVSGVYPGANLYGPGLGGSAAAGGGGGGGGGEPPGTEHGPYSSWANALANKEADNWGDDNIITFTSLPDHKYFTALDQPGHPSGTIPRYPFNDTREVLSVRDVSVLDHQVATVTAEGWVYSSSGTQDVDWEVVEESGRLVLRSLTASGAARIASPATVDDADDMASFLLLNDYQVAGTESTATTDGAIHLRVIDWSNPGSPSVHQSVFYSHRNNDQLRGNGGVDKSYITGIYAGEVAAGLFKAEKTGGVSADDSSFKNHAFAVSTITNNGGTTLTGSARSTAVIVAGASGISGTGECSFSGAAVGQMELSAP